MTDVSLQTLEEAQHLSKDQLNAKVDELMDEFNKSGDIEYALLASEFAEVWRKRYGGHRED